MFALPMVAFPILGAGMTLSAAAPLFLRAGWRGRQAFAWLGLGLFALSLALLVHASGAWGAAMGFTIAIAVALLLLAVSAWQSEPARRAVIDRGTAKAAQATGGDLSARLLALVMAGPVMALCAAFLGLGLDRLCVAMGLAEADGIATALLVAPFAWAAGMSVQLINQDRRALIAPPLACLVVGGATWIAL